MSPPGGDLTSIEENLTGSDPDSGSPANELTGGPTVQVIFPNGSERLEVNSIVDIRIFARHPEIPDPVVRVFHDRDANPANGNVTIGTVKTSQAGVAWDTTGLATGSYWVGLEMVGVTPALIDYSDEYFQLVPPGQGGSGGDGGGDGGGGGGDGGIGDQDIMLTVTTPRVLTTIFQSRTYQIRWSTNLMPGEGTAEVFCEPDFDEDGIPDGHAYRDVIPPTGIDAATQRHEFDMEGRVGRYFIGVTVHANDGRVATAYSSGVLNIVAPVLWTGELGTKRDEDNQPIAPTGPFRGAVFKGHNPYDNLGSAMLAADDYDDDGINEIVMAAQFAKAFNFARDGRGAGEAYMMYGQSQRFLGDIDVNRVGSDTLPGAAFSGIVPNPYTANEQGGNSYAYDPEGRAADRFATEGLRTLALIPDQDNDGKKELVFGFPWCNSLSLRSQILEGIHPYPQDSLGRLENDGHFLRGGTVIVSSVNSVLSNRQGLSRHNDRVIQLGEVGQVFSTMDISPDMPDYVGPQDLCTARGVDVAPPDFVGGADDAEETVTFPCEGFYQNTIEWMDPPRLADPWPARGMSISPYSAYGCFNSYPNGANYISLDQVDPVPVTTSQFFFEARVAGSYGNYPKVDDYCQSIFYPQFGYMSVLGTGFYGTGNSVETRVISPPQQPYGCRILGQTTTQLYTTIPTTANRFGASLSVSGNFLMVGAPLRTALWKDIPYLPENRRLESGVVYLLSLKRPGMPSQNFFWSLPDAEVHNDVPAPHNYVIKDVGYSIKNPGSYQESTSLNGPRWEITHPIQIVGAAPTDRIGDAVMGLYDVNNDGVDDVAVGGAGTNGGRGAVYLLYRRQPELEHDYLLERLQLPTNHPDRLTGLFIIGEQGENLGTALGGLGPDNMFDDYNHDNYADLLIGSPNASPSAGFEAGQVFVLFGGNTLLSPAGGVTIAQLVAEGYGMLLTGAEAGDRAGEAVANAGDVNGDGIPDILIAAPNATVPDIKFRNPGRDAMRSLRVPFEYDSTGDGILDATGIGVDLNGDGIADALNDNNELDVDGNIIYDADDDLTNCGLVYLVFGGPHLDGVISLDEIGTKALPGMVFVGRQAGNELGGGRTQNGLLSQGLAFAGDLDGDGFGDVMISSVLASPDDKAQAGEVYVIYGLAP